MALLPYVTAASESKSRDLAQARLPQAIVALVWLVAATGAIVAGGFATVPRAGALVLAMAIVTAVTGLRYKQRVGGVTGDFLGATEQLGELAALAVLAWPS
jgi:adenosylcobinamide-GDP ribazoletransferase